MNEEIAHRFAYHPPKNEAAVKAHERVRELLGDVAQELDALLPGDRPREKALVQTHLEDAMYAANAAIARSRTGVEDG
jgi:hypothetical protein